METGLHKPRFKLFHLAVLVAVLALVFAIVPASASPPVAGVIILGAFLRSVTNRITPIEWLVLAAIGFVLVALVMPPVTPDHSRRNRMIRPTIQPTTTPVPIKP